MIRCAALLLAVTLSAACYSVQIDADGATRVRGLGSVSVETHACGEAAAQRVCVSAKGGTISESAGGLLSGVLGFLLGR